MKKILLFSTFCALSVSSFAQKAQPKMYAEPTKKTPLSSLPIVTTPNQSIDLSKVQRTTATPFITENFGSGTSTILPTGWAVPQSQTFNWKWANTASTAPYSIGAINSTTAANGWLIFDSDSFGQLYPSFSQSSYITSPSYNCTGHAAVVLSFEEWFRRYNDSCFVEVSNNSGTTWTAFRITPNNNLGTSASVPTNSYKVRVNISSVAANQANVLIRFHYIGGYGGGYSWLIDDLALTEPDAKDAMLNKVSLLELRSAAGDLLSFSALPVQLADSLFPVSQVGNNGSTASNITVSANIHKGSSVVYTQSNTYNNLAALTYDSLVYYTQNYMPTSTGQYTALLNASVTGDADLSNNTDSFSAMITDTLWSHCVGDMAGGYYVHKAGTASTTASYAIGALFSIPAGKSDTLTGASVAFNSTTTPGANVGVQIYAFDPAVSSWAAVAATYYKALTAADISTVSTPVYCYLGSDFTSAPGSSFILNGGTNGTVYAAVVVGNAVPNSATVIIGATAIPTIDTRITDFGGTSDTSYNNGNFTFAQSGLPGKIQNVVPMIRLHFGHAPMSLNANTALIKAEQVDVYPNPANTTLTFAYTLQNDANVTIKLLNTLGQVVKSVAAGNVSGNQKTTTQMATDNLANGVYFYTIEANGERLTNRVVVQH